MGPHQSQTRPLLLLPLPPSHQFSQEWCPLTTSTPPLPHLLHPHLLSKQDHRLPLVMLHLHPHLSLKRTPHQAHLVELLSLAVGASPLPLFTQFPDQAPLLLHAVPQTPCLRRTPVSRRFILSPQNTSQDHPSLAYTHKQVTLLGQ